MRKVEDICIFYKKAPKYNPQGLVKIENPEPKVRKEINCKNWIYRDTLNGEFKPQWTNYPNNVLEVKTERDYHPTQKSAYLR